MRNSSAPSYGSSPLIHHVTREIRPSALPECIAFYGLLGFQPIPVPPGIAGRSVWLERSSSRPASQIHLMLSDDAHPQQGHVAFVVDPYEATLERLRNDGFSVEPRRPHWGAPRAYVHDPAGNLVELMARAPGSPEKPAA